MAMPMQHAEMGRVAPDGVVYHQRIDLTAEHEELRHMDEELVDPNEYLDEQEWTYVNVYVKVRELLRERLRERLREHTRTFT
uniref:Uncharacterized protein n=1 Tax=Parascaris univalens TaxID=6257 RepID=A0A914ZYS7_PARUN